MTYLERIGQMLQDLEHEGFNIYYDEVSNEWECMNSNSDFSVAGKDKFQVIQDAWRQVMLG